MKNYKTNINIIDNQNLQGKILNFFIIAFVVLAAFYIFLTGRITLNVIERKAMIEDMQVLANEIGELELSYFSLSSKVDLNMSYDLGFSETKSVFAVRKPLGTNKLSFDAKEIVRLAKND